jgi:hypothetical protein
VRIERRRAWQNLGAAWARPATPLEALRRRSA